MAKNKTNNARRLRRDQTEAERELWARLRNRRLDGWKFKRQVPKGPYVVDFFCADAHLIVELDGGQHGEEHAIAHDAKRTILLEECGYRVVGFWNHEIFKDIDRISEIIWHILQEPPLPNNADHSLSPTGRGLG